MDWHPEHEGEWKSRLPRLARAVEWAGIVVLVLAVIAAGTATVVILNLLPWGLR